MEFALPPHRSGPLALDAIPPTALGGTIESLIAPLGRELLGLPAWEWLLVALSTALATTVILSLRKALGRLLGRLGGPPDDRGIDEFVVDIVCNLHPVTVILGSAALAASLVDLPATADQWIRRLAVVGVLVQGTAWALMLVRRSGRVARSRPPGSSHASLVRALVLLAQIVVWSIAALLLLDVLGFDVTTIVAGLGVGGIAVALAAKGILEDLFAALSILIDRPFEDGDFLVIGDLSGTVERVGLRSTRVRALQGEELVFSNRDLLSARIRNFGRMVERRVVLEIGVTYDTSPEQLRAIPGIVEGAVASQELARFDRCHFAELGASSMEFEGVFYVEEPDYARMMDIREAVLLSVVEAFDARDIRFAFPTRTVVLDELPDGRSERVAA